jgi:hypothetical protein
MSAGQDHEWLRELYELFNFIDEFQSAMLHHREFSRVARLAFNSVNHANALLNHDRRLFPVNVDAELAEARNLFTQSLNRIEVRTGQSLAYWATAQFDDSHDLGHLSETLRIIGDEIYKPVHLLDRAARDVGPYLKPLELGSKKPERKRKTTRKADIDSHFVTLDSAFLRLLLNQGKITTLAYLEGIGLKSNEKTLGQTKTWRAKQSTEKNSKREGTEKMSSEQKDIKKPRQHGFNRLGD